MHLPAAASQEVAAQGLLGALLGRHRNACWAAECEMLTINGKSIDSCERFDWDIELDVPGVRGTVQTSPAWHTSTG